MSAPSSLHPFRAVTRKELRGRLPLLTAALALGCLPFVLPLLPQARGQSAADLRVAAAPILAALGATLLALLLGAELLARELAERRLSFYLARPISLSTLWGAKLTAAYAVLLAGAACMVAPVALVDPLGTPRGMPLLLAAFFLPALLLLLLLAASALAIFARARSPRLAVDVAGLLVSSVLVGSPAARLARAGAQGSLVLGLGLVIVAAIVSLYLAHAAALEHGRSDLRRASASLSLRLWSLLLPSTAAFALFAAWTLSPSPAALREVWLVQPAPQGQWLALSGRLAGRFDLETVFLWHPASGRFFRIPEALPHGYEPSLAFSTSGSAAVWVEREDAQWVVWSLDLVAAARGEAEPVRTRLSYGGLPSRMTVSPNGRLVASHTQGRWLLDDLVTGRLLASVADDNVAVDARWISDDRLRIFEVSGYERPVATARAWELTPALLDPQPLFSASLGADAVPVFVSDLEHFVALQASLDGRRLLLRDQSGWRLCDADRGTVLAEIAPREPATPDGGQPARPVFFADGRILERRRAGADLALRVRDRDGGVLFETILRDAGRTALAGMPGPELLWLIQRSAAGTGTPKRAVSEDQRLLEVDLRTGNRVERGRGLSSSYAFTFDTGLPTGDAARWLLDTQRRLRYLRPDGVLIDPLRTPAL